MRLPKDPEDMSLPEAAEYWVSKMSGSKAPESIRTYRKDVDPFLMWCGSEGVDIQDLDEWELERYQAFAHENPEWNIVTVKNKLRHLKKFVKFLGESGIIDEYLHPAIDVPQPGDQEVNTEKWDKTNAIPQIRFFRNSPQHRGKRYHTVTEVEWFTGARQRAIRAPDLEDYVRDPPRDHHAEGPYIRFRHRPETGTRLKKGKDSERYVEISEAVADTIDYYINHHRIDIRDEYGREPLFTTKQGRISRTTIREDTYYATLPCLRIECPHGNEKESCEWSKHREASGCPSTKSSHRLRTGSIQWQLDQGIPVEDVAERCDMTPRILRKHYDVPEDAAKMNRRRQYTSVLEESIKDADDEDQE